MRNPPAYPFVSPALPLPPLHGSVNRIQLDFLGTAFQTNDPSPLTIVTDSTGKCTGLRNWHSPRCWRARNNAWRASRWTKTKTRQKKPELVINASKIERFLKLNMKLKRETDGYFLRQKNLSKLKVCLLRIKINRVEVTSKVWFTWSGPNMPSSRLTKKGRLKEFERTAGYYATFRTDKTSVIKNCQVSRTRCKTQTKQELKTERSAQRLLTNTRLIYFDHMNKSLITCTTIP